MKVGLPLPPDFEFFQRDFCPLCACIFRVRTTSDLSRSNERLNRELAARKIYLPPPIWAKSGPKFESA